MSAQSGEHLPDGTRRSGGLLVGNRCVCGGCLYLGLLGPSHLAAVCVDHLAPPPHSLADMKLMWGFTSGNRGRLLLNSVMSWITVGCRDKTTGEVKVQPLLTLQMRQWCHRSEVVWITWGREGAGARLTSFWAGNSPTMGPVSHQRVHMKSMELTETRDTSRYSQESISLDRTCTDTLCLFRAPTVRRSWGEKTRRGGIKTGTTWYDPHINAVRCAPAPQGQKTRLVSWTERTDWFGVGGTRDRSQSVTGTIQSHQSV